jgi:hypothetical protein
MALLLSQPVPAPSSANLAATLKRMYEIFEMEQNLFSAKLCCSFFCPPLRDHARFLAAALVCIAVLYGVDALFFDGQYGQGIERTISDIHQHW